MFPMAVLRGLKPNWNSYGAPVIDERCIQKAYELWRQLSGEWQVVPCNDGGVQLEQHRDGFDIEITISAMGESPTVPVGHFWRGDIDRYKCKHCGEHYIKHLLTDEAATCPTANREENP